jgi:CRISPR-associated endonuclease/helicase Cas3
MAEFCRQFEDLTDHRPFPWQEALFHDWFKQGEIPKSCNLPTGLGKTSVIAVWLIALAEQMQDHRVTLPRRLVYVVNRRTVVDQTTTEVEKLRANLPKLNSGLGELAISTLRGQFADNREWSADPSCPAVICGTVDMIGSRLLFSGYGVGFKSKPLHAGFLGQDALLVHDEAHLEPAFQNLIEQIEDEQCRERKLSGDLPWPKLRVMQLTATTRNGQDKGPAEDPFGLSSDEQNPPKELPGPPTEPIHHVWRRLKAKKELGLTPVGDDKQAPSKIAEIAAGYKDANTAVLVFVRTLEAVSAIEKELVKTERPVVLLTGTMRGKERDDLVKKPEFKRFFQGAEPGETVYLVCTSAGEVGIDISADHMVCDLSTFESMAQRFGRVNRYGEPVEHVAKIDVVYPTSFGKTDKRTGELKADEIDKRRQKTLELLKILPALGENQYDASPLALSELDLQARLAAFAPEPIILPATDILFDAWSMTSIRQPMPGRAPVEPYLHGIAEWQPPETHVAWRREVEIITGDLLEQYPPADLLDDYPLKPHELLRDATDRKSTGVFAQLGKMAKRALETTIWIIDARGEVKLARLQDVVDGNSRRLHGATVILPPIIGGLTTAGTLDGDTPFVDELRYDVAEEWFRDKERQVHQRTRVWDDDATPAGMRWVRTIDTRPDAEDDDETLAARRFWHWYELPAAGDSNGSKSALEPIRWQHHTDDVTTHATRFADALLKDQLDLHAALILAAKLHDLGKKRQRWQRSIGHNLPDNPQPDDWLAKSGKGMKPRRINDDYRHEFGSLLDVLHAPDSSDPLTVEFNNLSDEMKDLVLHLIASHHGRARPHFPPDEAIDLERSPSDAETLAIETPRRFARLQRKYGRWGLAYLESLLRAADWAASAKPSRVLDASGNEVTP